MIDIKIVCELAAKMLKIASDEFSNHRCNDLDEDIIKLIPTEWCEEARQLNSKGKDPWPVTTSDFGDSGLMWLLSEKLKHMSASIDRDNKLNELLNDDKIFLVESKEFR